MTPKVSIIIPFFNAGRYLSEAIESVQLQTVPDWELLLIDDASTDNSASEAIRASQADARIKIVHTSAAESVGAAAARNLGIRAASGEYLAFLDADDVFLPNKIEVQVQALDANPDAAMVYGPTEWWHPSDPKLDWVERVKAPRVIRPPKLLESAVLLLRNHVPCICSVLVRRRVVDAVGGFEEAFRLYEDQTLWVKIMAAYQVLSDQHVTARYRQHATSVSAQSAGDGSYDRLKPHSARFAFLHWTEAYLRTKALIRPSTESALRRAKAVLSGDPSELSPSDRILSAVQVLGRQARRAGRRFRRIAF